jgi:hypothetical protein
MIDQFVALTIIGVIIVLIGLALHVAKMKGGLLLILLGGLWLFTMVLYYGLVAAGIYGTEFHVAKNAIGVIILVVGGVLSIQYLRKYLQTKK